MALVTTKEMFEKAYNGGYAIGAFNVNNMEIVQGITEAAAEEMLLLFCRFPRVPESMQIIHIS
jgi:Fructose/tagatose bisphosphate aldolase